MRQRMLTPVFQTCGETQQLGLVELIRTDRDNRRLALGKRPCLVENEGIDFLEVFERFCALDQNAGARAATLSAAADLYGSGSSQYNGVASGWSAVGVN